MSGLESLLNASVVFDSTLIEKRAFSIILRIFCKDGHNLSGKNRLQATALEAGPLSLLAYEFRTSKAQKSAPLIALKLQLAT